MKKLFIIALALSVLCVMLAAPSFADEAKKEEAKMPAGQKVFTEAKCQMCHTVYSSGIGEPPAADAKKEEDDESGPPDLSLTGAGKTAEWMSLFLQKKEALNEKKHMKKFAGSDEELAALVDWLMTLKPAEKEAPKAEKADGTSEAPAEKGSSCGHDHGDHDKAAEHAEEDKDSHEGHDHGDHDTDTDAEAEKGE